MIGPSDEIALAATRAVPRARPLPPGLGSVLLLTALAALGQFASTIYTPSLPFVAVSLRVDASAAQLTLAVFLFAFAVSQLAYGPLTDRFGRRPVLFVGLVLFLAGTLACALAETLTALLWARVAQAVGAAGAVVVSRAATRDSFDGVELARTIAAITIAFALVPGLTPLIGGVVQELAGWREIFWLTLAVGGVVTVVAATKLPETARSRIGRIDAREIGRGYGAVLSDRTAVSYALTAGLVFGAMSAFFAASPALYIGHLGVRPAEYGLYPPLAVTGFVIGGIITRRLAGKVAARRIAGAGLAILGVGVTLMLAIPALGLVHKHVFNGAMIVIVTGLGVFLPTAIAQVLSRFPDRAGSAAALQGFFQMSGGALGAVAVSAVQPTMPIFATPVVMASSAGMAIFLFLVAVPRTTERGFSAT